MLAAEDIEIIRQIINAAFAKTDHIDVVLAENGQEAIDTLEQQTFDIVLMDIQMPVMSGEEAIRRIRTSGKAYSSVPIIVLSANAFTEQVDEYIALGATDH